MGDLSETVREFLVESFENLDRLDQELIALEESPHNAESINQVFRIVHTIKGTCGFFEFQKLETLSHVGENLLDSLRDGKIVIGQDVITALLQLGDALRLMLSTIERTGGEGSEDYAALREILTQLNLQADSSPAQSAESVQNTRIISLEHVVIDPPTEIDQRFLADSSPDAPPVDESLEGVFQAAREEYLQQSDGAAGAAPMPQLPPAPEQLAQSAAPAAAGAEEQKKSELTETTLRVDVNLLDKLMNLVGELVLARNQILQFNKNQLNGDFASTSQRLNLITSELQEGVMRTRMQPIANVWNKLPRIVRDVATSCGKQAKLEMQGKETELDKTIIEAIKDPLTHIIRNAVDHGIESPNERIRFSKNPEGVLSMRAFHEGGQVIIEISDDGAGLHVDRIRRKAIERGIVTTDKASRMNEQEIQRLIFLPGFSTAEKVTNISGRGVGMDVVRANIERIGGTVDVSSRFQHGTTFTIKIPLTLAIIPALIVTACGHRYAIPQVNLVELVRIEGDQIKKNLEEIHYAMFYRLRGKLLPLVRLRGELDLDAAESRSIKEAAVLNIVVVRADNHQFGLIVDAIFDTEEIVVKPMGKLLKSVKAFAGATIMGDGRVALILDVVGLAQKAQITKEETGAADDEERESAARQDRRKLLIFRIGDDRRAAIMLDEVHRLEEFEPSTLERAGGCTVVQYRDSILPLIDLHEALNGSKLAYDSAIQAFVHKRGDRYVGFVVQEILDIVEQAVKIETPYRRAGLLGSAIIQGVVTDLVDLSTVLPRDTFECETPTEGPWNRQ